MRLPAHQNIVLPGFHVSSLPDCTISIHYNTSQLTFAQVPLYTPTSQPLLPTSGSEIVLFVGYPCLGKTSLFRRVFEPAGYMHVNQDILKTRFKCANAVRDILQSEHSCIVGM